MTVVITCTGPDDFDTTEAYPSVAAAVRAGWSNVARDDANDKYPVRVRRYNWWTHVGRCPECSDLFAREGGRHGPL